jgi:hypothetical protein
VGGHFRSAARSLDGPLPLVEDSLRIEGKTAIGRATVEALQLNREVLVEARGTWIAAGLHPPTD